MKTATRANRLNLKGYTDRSARRCVGCRARLVGPGDRCPACQAELRARPTSWRATAAGGHASRRATPARRHATTSRPKNGTKGMSGSK
jgi:predicted amidophosphoribosyltransferase